MRDYGDTEGLIFTQVNKMYGNIAEFPSSILNDIAKENHEQAMKEMQIKDTLVDNVCLVLCVLCVVCCVLCVVCCVLCVVCCVLCVVCCVLCVVCCVLCVVCFVLFCFVLFCFVLFCFVLFCFVLFCLFVCFVCLFCLFFCFWRIYCVMRDHFCAKVSLHSFLNLTTRCDEKSTLRTKI
jgi:hypothetical protein